MKKRNRRGMALLLSLVILASSVQISTMTVRAEKNSMTGTSSEAIVTGNDLSSISFDIAEQYFDLGDVETSAIPMSAFSLSDGNVSLKDGTATEWINRLDLTDAKEIRDFYDILVEASDNDGTNDYLIEDIYFDGDNTITVATVTGSLEGTYSEQAAGKAIEEVASEVFANYAGYIRAAYDAFDRDHPEVFWLAGRTQAGCGYSYSLRGSEGAYTVSYNIAIKFVLQGEDFDIRATNYNTESKIKTAIQTVGTRVRELVNAVSDKTIEEKITYFNEQLTKTNQYNTSLDSNTINHDCRECTAALSGKTGTDGPVCESYARAFKVLCDEVGIPCVLVDGQAKTSPSSDGGAHMWNYVRVNGEWLAVDVTWNDPVVNGTSGAVSRYENEDWLLLYENDNVNGMTFIESHPVANQASSNGVGFTNGPKLAIRSFVKEVFTEEQFYKALADSDIYTIELQDNITLSRTSDSKDNAVVINRPVTITGNDVGGLDLERSGIILNGDVTFENMTLAFNSPVRNAIIANGHNLTINNVSNIGTYNIDFFCGGITDYNGGNGSEILQNGSDGSITIKGTNTFNGSAANGVNGGTIYAGSLSDIGYTDELGNPLENIPNTYTGTATITIEADATGVNKIYGHGAREDRSGRHANEWLSDADLYKASGEVNIHLNNNSSITIDGATGGEKNATLIYKDNGTGYRFAPSLENVGSIKLLPTDNGAVTYLEPSTTQTAFDTLSVPENTKLSFVTMGNEISADALVGGGTLIFAEKTEAYQKLTLSSATGTTKVAVEDVTFDGTGSTGIINSSWNCITVTDTTSQGEFILMPNANNSDMYLEKDSDGNWTTISEGSSVLVKEISVEKTFTEEAGIRDTYIPITVAYDIEDENNSLRNIPMIITVNGEETVSSNAGLGYDYVTGDTDSDLIMWFEYGNNMNEELLYITSHSEDEDASIPTGTYEISISIPQEYMEDGESKTISFVLNVGKECEGNHTDSDLDGDCDECGSKVYLIGATSKCLENGEDIAHISMNLSNQLASAKNDVTVTAQSMLRYTFKGWYLAGDIDESNQIIDGKEALSTSLVYTFKPNVDMDLVAVYEAKEKEATITFDTNTNFTVAINGEIVTGTQNENTYIVSALIGDQITVTVNDEDYINWCNDNGKIVTTKDTYTFTLTGDVTLNMSKEENITESAMVAFVSDYNQVLAGQIYKNGDEITFPIGPSKTGYIFKGWSLTQDEIHEKIIAGENYITVRPIYTQEEAVYTVTVYVNGEVNDTLSITDILAGTIKRFSAPDIEDKVFLYWTDENDNILGYDVSYGMKINKNTTLKAVYGEKESEKKPVIAMTDVCKISENGKNKISFIATRNISEEYTLVEHGILYCAWTEDTAPSEETFIVGGSNIRKSVSSDAKRLGVFTMNLNVTGKENTRVVARGYIIVKTEEGSEEIYYTDIADCTYNTIK